MEIHFEPRLKWAGGAEHALSRGMPKCYDSGVTEGGQRGAVAPGRSRQGGAKQPDQKYFMTNDHKSEFDRVY